MYARIEYKLVVIVINHIYKKNVILNLYQHVMEIFLRNITVKLRNILIEQSHWMNSSLVLEQSFVHYKISKPLRKLHLTSLRVSKGGQLTMQWHSQAIQTWMGMPPSNFYALATILKVAILCALVCPLPTK